MFWILLTFMGTLDAIGMFFAKKAADTLDPKMWGITILIYALIGGVFAQTLRYEGLTITNIIWSLFIIIFGSFVGLVIFKENLSILQWVGFFMAIVSIVLIQWPTK